MGKVKNEGMRGENQNECEIGTEAWLVEWRRVVECSVRVYSLVLFPQQLFILYPQRSAQPLNGRWTPPVRFLNGRVCLSSHSAEDGEEGTAIGAEASGSERTLLNHLIVSCQSCNVGRQRSIVHLQKGPSVPPPVPDLCPPECDIQ